MISATTVYAVGTGTKWAYEKVEPVAFLILTGIAVGAVVLYRSPPEGRRKAIRQILTASATLCRADSVRRQPQGRSCKPAHAERLRICARLPAAPLRGRSRKDLIIRTTGALKSITPAVQSELS